MISEDNLILGSVHDYSNVKEAKEALNDLHSGAIGLSHRRRLKLDIED